MEIYKNISLAKLTTMKIGGNAAYYAEASTVDEIYGGIDFAKSNSLPVFIIGGGSNTIASDETYPGLILKITIKGFEIINDTPKYTTIKIGAGEIWDKVVEKTTEMNLSGIEAMSAIPGTCGAAPVQNVGAYGQEIAQTLVELEAIDREVGEMVILDKNDCGFSYRNSIFKSSAIGRYIITSITIKLRKDKLKPPFYPALEKYLQENEINDFSPSLIRQAVTKIRSKKLPDPEKLPNSGSFFKNAIVSKRILKKIKKDYPDIPSYSLPDRKVKIPTGWLIDKTGLKGETINGIQINPNNALVLINESAQNHSDLESAKQAIVNSVYNQFGIEIEQEPIEIKNFVSK